jgi:predicted RNA-binding Zn-ribbon protein involved in translation (DUF1610 family)
MNDNKDDPRALLFTCEHCGFWPMAYQGPRPFGSEISFTCPRCRRTSVFRKSAPRSEVEAVAG